MYGNPPYNMAQLKRLQPSEALACCDVAYFPTGCSLAGALSDDLQLVDLCRFGQVK